MNQDTETAPQLTPGQRWKEEIAQAKEYLRPWHDSAREILKRLKDQRPRDAGDRRINLFAAGYQTQRAILYGKTPTVSVSRRWKDADDDVARVAGEMLGRHLNDEVSSGCDGYGRALGYALEDRLSVGMGMARVRYVAEMEAVANEARGVPSSDDNSVEQAPGLGSPALFSGGSPEGTQPTPGVLLGNNAGGQPQSVAEANPAPERKAYEAAKVDYVYWEDVIWSPCRYWEVARWVAFKAEMSRKALIKRFGQAKGGSIPLDAARVKDDAGKNNQPEPPWGRATVWEVWDKEEKEVVWVTESGVVLDTRKDPYKLRDFFPCPRPFFSLITTDEMIPRPDFSLAEDIYRDLDTLTTRMHLLRTALRVVGMFDASNTELAELLTSTDENRMIPVKNWAMFGEKGGLRGAVDFFPVQEVAAALVSLTAEYEALKARLYEVTGMSDILRGQASAIQTTASEQRIKAQFGSARLQAVQDEFARFATELQVLKSEVIANLFEPEEIVRASNLARTKDAPLAMDAALLLKNSADAFRVKVQPESLALSDFAAVKEERLEVVAAVAQFVSGITPLLGIAPMAAPALLEILKWLVASLRGASEIEGVLDEAMAMAQQAAQQAQQQPQQAQPDPKLVAQQMKGQQEEKKIQLELQADLARTSAEMQANSQREVVQREQNVLEAHQKAIIQRATSPRQEPGIPGQMG